MCDLGWEDKGFSIADFGWRIVDFSGVSVSSVHAKLFHANGAKRHPDSIVGRHKGREDVTH